MRALIRSRSAPSSKSVASMVLKKNHHHHRQRPQQQQQQQQHEFFSFSTSSQTTGITKNTSDRINKGTTANIKHNNNNNNNNNKASKRIATRGRNMIRIGTTTTTEAPSSFSLLSPSSSSSSSSSSSPSSSSSSSGRTRIKTTTDAFDWYNHVDNNTNKQQSNNNNSSNNTKKSSITLQSGMVQMNDLLKRREELVHQTMKNAAITTTTTTTTTTTVSLDYHDIDDDESKQLIGRPGLRELLFHDTMEFVHQIKESIENGTIQPNRKENNLLLSDLLGGALEIFSTSPPTTSPRNNIVSATTNSSSSSSSSSSPFDQCLQVMDILYDANLDLTPQHYHCAIRAACHEQKWTEASELFLSQVDPDAGAVVPMVDFHPPHYYSYNNHYDSADANAAAAAAAAGGIGKSENNDDNGYYKSYNHISPCQMGLYAVTKMAQEKNAAAAAAAANDKTQNNNNDNKEESLSSMPILVGEYVFNVALRMAMISPANEHNYILAAGAALGQAGEWEACVKFLNSSYHSMRLGQVLVAATMDACIECQQYNQALKVLDDLLNGPVQAGGEWQWGGGTYHQLDPLVRDLAMQCLGRADFETVEHNDNDEGMTTTLGSSSSHSDRAMALLTQVLDEQAPISLAAVRGVLASLEKDGKWQDAMAILELVLSSGEEGSSFLKIVPHPWGVRQEEQQAIVAATFKSKQQQQLLAIQQTTATANNDLLSLEKDILVPVMKSCIAAGHFGLALYFARLVNAKLLQQERKPTGEASSLLATAGSPSLFPLVLLRHEETLVAGMVALCGLEQYDAAIDLFDSATKEAATASPENASSLSSSSPLSSWFHAMECKKYAEKMRSESLQAGLEKAWEDASMHMDRLLALEQFMNNLAPNAPMDSNEGSSDSGSITISPQQQAQIITATAKMMQSFAAANQPMAGLVIARRILNSLLLDPSTRGEESTMPSSSRSFGVANAVHSLFADTKNNSSNSDDALEVEALQMALLQSKHFGPLDEPGTLCANDEILAATLLSYRNLGWSGDAVEVFFSVMEQVLAITTAGQQQQQPPVRHYHSSTHDNIKIPSGWTQSVNEAIGALVDEGLMDDAVELFRNMANNSVATSASSTDADTRTYLTLVHGLAQHERWREITPLYHEAMKSGAASSEDFGFLALKAETETDKQIHALGSIENDMAKAAHMAPKQWRRSRYWTIKRLLGVYYAKLLVWRGESNWKDLELDVALEHLEERRSQGLKARNAVVSCIVELAGYRQRPSTSYRDVGEPIPDVDEREDPRGRETQEMERALARDMILQALREAKLSHIQARPRFVDKVSSALRALKANVECVEYVTDAVMQGIYPTRKAVMNAVLAAEASGDPRIADDLLTLVDKDMQLDMLQISSSDKS